MAKGIESWKLFWLLALITSSAICSALPSADFHLASGITPIIQRSVRCALPWFVVAFTGSSMATLWPSRVTRWQLRNRRYFGLAFAFGMAWHFSFVGYSIYRFGLAASGLSISATTTDAIAFVFLLLMTLTSFRWPAHNLTAANWRRLHKAGVYVIWAVAAHIYLGGVLHGRDLLHCLAFALLVEIGRAHV